MKRTDRKFTRDPMFRGFKGFETKSKHGDKYFWKHVQKKRGK